MALPLPDLTEVEDYLGMVNVVGDHHIQRALNAEIAAQKATVRARYFDPDQQDTYPYSDDLRLALLRRVARNLALKKLPIMVAGLSSDDAGDRLVLPGRDPEVRRLESPYRKMVIG